MRAWRRMNRRMAIAGLWVSGLVAAPASADPDPALYFNREDFSSEALYATGEVGVGARAMGMGGAFAGVADDVTALYYNPAGLAQLVRIETTLGVQHLRDESKHDMFGTGASGVATHTGLDQFGIAYPFPTYRGSLVIAGGVARARSNDLQTSRSDRRPGYNDDFLRAQRDGIYRYTGGFGVDLLESLSFGASLSYWEGQLRDDQYRTIDETAGPPAQSIDRLVTNADVDGFSFDLGLMGYVGRSGRVALALRSPVWLDITGDGQLVHQDVVDGPSSTQLLYIDQQPRLPWSMSIAASWALRWLLLASDARYTAWDEVDLDTNATGSAAPLPGQAPDYASKWSVRVGAEALVPFTPLRLRGGYAYDPEPYSLLLGNPSRMVLDKFTWSFGGGILLADAFALDLGVTLGHFERADLDYAGVSETRDAHRLYLTGAYRY